MDFLSQRMVCLFNAESDRCGNYKREAPTCDPVPVNAAC